MSWLALAAAWGIASAVGAGAAEFVQLEAETTPAGYVARLLINEAPFPGERGYVSETDTRETMRSVLWVLHARACHVPAGYKREEIAATPSTNILELITAKNQCEGFTRDAAGQRVMAPRVKERVRYLLSIANSGGKPGRFAALLAYAQSLANAYFAEGAQGEDLFAGLALVEQIPVTGRAYSWMTGQDVYHPGGNFVRIPEAQNGLLGGNRFFTLRKEPQGKSK